MAATATAGKDLVITSLKGGMNDTDSPHTLPDDQCMIANNVEFFRSSLGERRRGMEEVSLTGSGIADEASIVFLTTHIASNAKISQSELWAVGATDDDATATFSRRVGSAWTDIVPVDAAEPTFPEIYSMQAESIHGKLFIAFKSQFDVLHVWDGTQLRPAGLGAVTGLPTVGNTGSGSFTTTRYYRVRFITMVGDEIVNRGEPSEEVSIEPSGSGSGVLITRPALLGQGETHWEVEASTGDGNFYIIATILKTTTNYVDSTTPATDYAIDGELSADIGDYTRPTSIKYIKKDQDRLIFAGSWEDEKLGSRIYWTPVWSAPGVGNDERVPVDTDNYLDLDWQAGGEITGVSDPVNGSFYVFKWSKIYKLQRTGLFDRAYEAFLAQSANGAVPGSIINGIDEFGRSCVYFLDPAAGPMRIGSQGLQRMKNLHQVWRRVNTSSELTVCHGVYYPDKLQIHWWISLDTADHPNQKVIIQTDSVRSNSDGTSRGWTMADGKIARAVCSTVFPETIINEFGATQLAYRPYIGLGFDDGPGIFRCDATDTDGGEEYRARILSKPYIAAGLMNKWGARAAALLASTNPNPDINITVRLIRDFGVDTDNVVTDFVPEDNQEDFTIKVFDNLKMSESRAIQFEFIEE